MSEEPGHLARPSHPDDLAHPARRRDEITNNPELFARMLDNQAAELQIRSEEVAIREREREGAHEYAMKALEVQAQDRREERIFHKGLSSKTFCFLCIVLAIVVSGFCYALALNKDAVVMEIVKAVAYIATGGIGGYGLKSIKVSKEDRSDDD